MNHTGGLPRYVMEAQFWKARLDDPDREFSPVELLSYIFDKDAVHPAGDGWSYSDTGYLVLGLVIEEITGTAYVAELERRILRPLALDNTTVSTGRVVARLPQGYTGDRVAPFYLPGRVVRDGATWWIQSSNGRGAGSSRTWRI